MPFFYWSLEMQVIFYKTTDDKNVINKTITNPVAYRLIVRDENYLSSIMLKMRSDLTGYNYCHIPFFNRFYFIDKIEKRGILYLVYLECDVLESYKDDILNSNAKFKRNLKNGDYMNFNIDSTIFKTVEKKASDITLPDESHYVLTTIAKGSGV